MITELRLAPIFSDGMVLQANHPINIFGQANKTMDLTIRLLGEEYNFLIQEGEFCVTLNQKPITKTPFEIEFIHANKTSVLKDCLIGDVYLCAGQSNMQYLCKDVINVEYIELPSLRLYEVPKLPYVGAEKEFDWLYNNDPKWYHGTKSAAKSFSAIGYMIGRDLSLSKDIPIGIISCNMGDTTIFSWLSHKAMKSSTAFASYLNEYENWREHYPTFDEYDSHFKKQVPILMNFYGLLDQYRSQGYCSEEVYRKAYEVYPSPYLPMGPKNQNRPSGCYDTMLSTIVPYGLKCMIYYQGENDVSRPDIYRTAIHRLIEDWRVSFQVDCPFINVQLAGHEYSETSGKDVARLRDAQASMINLEKKQYLVTAIDYGERSNIHPLNKTVVAERIFHVIEEYIYDEYRNPLSPMVESYEVEDKDVIIHTTLNPLDLYMKQEGNSGFFFEDMEGSIEEIHDVMLKGNQIILHIEKDCKTIYYAYDGFPSVTVYTENDLPLLPFCIEIMK